MLSKHLREIEKSASNILGGNWRFFYNFNNKKYPLSKEKVIGELLVQCHVDILSMFSAIALDTKMQV